jgi:hypothetical protein
MDEPLKVFTTISCFLASKCVIFKGAAERRCVFECLWGDPPANVSQAIGNPPTNLLQVVRGYWQPMTHLLESPEGIGNPLADSSEGTGIY